MSLQCFLLQCNIQIRALWNAIGVEFPMCTNGEFKKFLEWWEVETTLMVAKIQHALNSNPIEAVYTLLPRSPSIEKYNAIAPSFVEQMGFQEQNNDNDNYKCEFYEYAALMHEIDFQGQGEEKQQRCL